MLMVCLGGDLLRFSVPRGAEKIAGLWFARGGSVPRLTLWILCRMLDIQYLVLNCFLL